MKYVEKPNLPQAAKIVLIGEKYSEILCKRLENTGIIPVLVPDNPSVDPRVSGHADLSVLHIGANRIILAKYLKGSGLERKLKELGMEIFFSKENQHSNYPFDSGLNVCACGKNIIYNPKTIDKSIVGFLTNSRGTTQIEGKQGYTKCSVCIINENAIITADEGIHKRVREAGIDSLLIKPGYIDLPGYDYGFIGGASFKIYNDTIAFTGNLDMHPDKDRILDFVSLHNSKIVYITEKPTFDVGSIIQIVEK